MVSEANKGNMAEVCRLIGISRQTGYEVLQRRRKEGYEGLRARSNAPHSRPHVMSKGVKKLVLELRLARQSGGAKKLKADLERLEGAKPEEEPLRMPAARGVGIF